MDELMKMLDDLFAQITEKVRRKEQERENPDDEGDPEKQSRVKMACSTVLSDMRREINSLECTLAVLNAKREMLIEEHNALVDEVKAMEERSTSTAPITETTVPMEGQPDGAHPLESLREEENHEEEHLDAEGQLDATFNLDGMSRLERLRFGLDHAIRVLEGSKMAFHFKAIKQLRLDLIELAKSTDKPEEERIDELEDGLKHTVEVLSTSPTASNSKTMRQLWSDLILVLKPESEPNQ